MLRTAGAPVRQAVVEDSDDLVELKEDSEHTAGGRYGYALERRNRKAVDWIEAQLKSDGSPTERIRCMHVPPNQRPLVQ